MRNTRVEIRPFLKWAGGKQKLVRKLLGLFPPKYHTYFEPFIGGGSIFLALQPECAVISDDNNWLIDCYLAIRDEWEEVADILDTMENTKEAFLATRSVCPSEIKCSTQRAAHLIYLNKTCFRGLFRVNRKGQFNVPYGAYDRRYYDPDNLEAVSEALKGVDIRSCDFENCLKSAEPGDFAYLDPPYYKLGGYSDFNRYTSSQFRENDHNRLAHLCQRLNNNGVMWALSNSDTPFVRELFAEFNIFEISARREINLNSRNRNVFELLITNYEVRPTQGMLF